MKMSDQQMHLIVQKVFAAWKKQNVVIFKESEKKVFDRAIGVLKEDYLREDQLDKEVQKKLDELERTNPGEFQRHKMFNLLKQKLAKERKIIL